MRKVPCSHCGGVATKGTSQVRKKLLFHFCVFCWLRDRAGCNATMLKIAP